MSNPARVWLGTFAVAFAFAAVFVTANLWPPTDGYYDNGATIALATAKACAATAGGTLLVAACVCAVGAVLARRP